MATRIEPAWRKPTLLGLALALLTLALYWPATHNGFVDYDDDEYVTQNGHVQSGLSWDNTAWAFTTTDVSNWHPLTWLSYMLDVELFGLDPQGFHATNIVLHALNAALLFWLLHGLTGALGPSLSVAALFAAHPLNVQSVAWVSERKNVLSTLFWLLAMLAYAAWVRRPRAASYAGLAVCLALSLLAKPMAVTLPFVLLLFDYWPLDRWRLGQRRLWLEKAPLFALVAVFSVVTFQVQHAGGSVIAASAIPASARAANAAWSYLAYLGKAVWPVGLAAFYPFPKGGLPAWRVALALGTIAAVTAVLFRRREALRTQLVGWLWYLGTLVPVIGLVQVGTQAMADRYAYIPLIGIFMAVAWAGAALVDRSLVPARVAAAAAAALVLAFSVRTLQQTATWHDSLALFEHTVRVEPAAWVAHYNLGNAYGALGRREDAIREFRATIQWEPGFARAYNNLGDALDALGRTTEAIPNYERAIQLKPDLVEAYNNLGIAYAAQGKPEAGVGMLRTATQMRPDFLEAHLNLAITFRQLGRLPESLASANQAVALRPGNALARYHRAVTLAQVGNLDAARQDLRVLQDLDPRLAARLHGLLEERDAPRP
jgi:protein O-mannosyl-transferase